MRFTLAQLATTTRGQWRGTSPDETRYCDGVTTDSRQIGANHCFFALRGQHYDGHDFVEQALQQEATCCVVDHYPSTSRGPLLQVADVATALGQLAAALRRDFKGTVVAITGSVGKTTTRHIIAHVLGLRWRTHQSPKNFNNHIGLPLTILSAPDDAEVMVVELGSSAPGEIAALSRIARPHIAVVTNAYSAHLAGFGSIEAIRREKLSLGEGLMPSGTFIVGADCPGLIEALPAHDPRLVTFGLASEADVCGSQVENEAAGSTVIIDGVTVYVPLPGPGNVQNALAAWAVYRCLGGTLQDFAAGLVSLAPVNQRAQVLQHDGLTVLNDCYNANPESMRNALATLQGLDPSGRRRRVFVCGDMAELGRQAQNLHEILGHEIVTHGIDHVLAVGSLAICAARVAARVSAGRVKISCYPNTDSACAGLSADIKKDDLILIKGSRAAGLEKIVTQLTNNL